MYARWYGISPGTPKLEEALLCLVLTNAVEVQVNGGSALGIAVYDWCFSWINHSCSPMLVTVSCSVHLRRPSFLASRGSRLSLEAMMKLK
ncbi:Protein SET domain group 41 [Vitis vinifera]|uniref:Protein SET domain group 41 n=1 Tax=Vitis vinifera TaxID=29760 RepID=A0A438JWE2_VITVI|nr:Protein SET domain group 41 [Vitis vinifera]